ncbi:MAG: dihydrofolate reductase family protein [Bacteroidota bacterium]
MNSVFIAMSLDGFIADKDGKIDWLHSIPNPDNDDMGYNEFMGRTDAIVMGRKTFETVLGFGIEWPYSRPVFVLSRSMKAVPHELQDHVELVSGPLPEVITWIHTKGHRHLYIDGGRTIQSFLQEDLIDELVVSTIPIVLGGGSPLFGALGHPLSFELVDSKTYLNAIVQRRYRRQKE